MVDLSGGFTQTENISQTMTGKRLRLLSTIVRAANAAYDTAKTEQESAAAVRLAEAVMLDCEPAQKTGTLAKSIRCSRCQVGRAIQSTVSV